MSQINQIQKTQFTDRNYSGDFGLLPIEIWDMIYAIKYALESTEYNQAKDKMLSLIHEEDAVHYTQYLNHKDTVNFNPEFAYIKNLWDNTDYFREQFMAKQMINSSWITREDNTLLLKTLDQKRPRIVNKNRVEYIVSTLLYELTDKIEDLHYENFDYSANSCIEDFYCYNPLSIDMKKTLLKNLIDISNESDRLLNNGGKLRPLVEKGQIFSDVF